MRSESSSSVRRISSPYSFPVHSAARIASSRHPLRSCTSHLSASSGTWTRVSFTVYTLQCKVSCCQALFLLFDPRLGCGLDSISVGFSMKSLAIAVVVLGLYCALPVTADEGHHHEE